MDAAGSTTRSFDARANATATTSGTWTSSSGDWPDASDTDVEVRDEFVEEYNRVAKKHGIPALSTDRHHTPSLPGQSPHHQRRSWFSRTFLRQASATASDASSTRSNKTARRRRSVSDLALHLVNSTARRDNLKDEDLQSLVRLCGKSKLYLAPAYSPGSLVLPTCFRATAQYLVQHGAETKGVFRIPGSVRTVNALYNHYCADGDGDDVASTICFPNLPSHIDAGAHDVASTFKRLLSGLPGGILGSAALFDAFVAIQDRLDGGDVGSGSSAAMRQFKLRARLIALAVGTVPSQLRRDLICAVFGLLCLIGCAAEEAAREEADTGKPSPKSDLMGYSALGIVFGPLLVGDLLDSYVMPSAHPNTSGSSLFPTVSSANARREKRRSKVSEEGSHALPSLAVDKIHAANSVTEMLIAHWREVVKHMRNLGVVKAGRVGVRLSNSGSVRMGLPLSASNPLRNGKLLVPASPTLEPVGGAANQPPALVIPRRRPRGMRPLSNGLGGARLSILSPPVEEPSPAGPDGPNGRDSLDGWHPPARQSAAGGPRGPYPAPRQWRFSSPVTPSRGSAGSSQSANLTDNSVAAGEFLKARPVRLVSEDGEEDSPSTPARSTNFLRRQNAERKPRAASRGPNPFKRRSHKDSLDPDSAWYARKQSAELPKTATASASQDVPGSTTRGSVENHAPAESEQRAHRGERPMSDMFGLGRARLSAWRFGRKSRGSTDTDSPAPRSRSPGRCESEVAMTTKGERRMQVRGYKTGSGSPSMDARQTYSSDGTGSLLEDWRSSMKAQGGSAPRLDIPSFGRGSPVFSNASGSSPVSGYLEQFRPLQALSGNVPAQRQSETSGQLGRKLSTSQDTDTSLRISHLGPRPDPAQPTLGSVPRSTPVKSTGNAVKAMAAKFESVTKDPGLLPAPRASPGGGRSESKSGGVLSPYTINPSPSRPPSRLPVPTDPIPSSRYMRLPNIPARRSRGSNGLLRADRAADSLGHDEDKARYARTGAFYNRAVSSGSSDAGGGFASPVRHSSPNALSMTGMNLTPPSRFASTSPSNPMNGTAMTYPRRFPLLSATPSHPRPRRPLSNPSTPSPYHRQSQQPRTRTPSVPTSPVSPSPSLSPIDPASLLPLASPVNPTTDPTAVPQVEISQRQLNDNDDAGVDADISINAADADISTNIDLAIDNEPDTSIPNHTADDIDTAAAATTDINTTDEININVISTTTTTTTAPTTEPTAPPTNPFTTTAATTTTTASLETELSTLRTRLRRAEASLSSWRARAEGAEQRVLELELKLALGLGRENEKRGLRKGLLGLGLGLGEGEGDLGVASVDRVEEVGTVRGAGEVGEEKGLDAGEADGGGGRVVVVVEEEGGELAVGEEGGLVGAGQVELGNGAGGLVVGEGRDVVEVKELGEMEL